MKIISFILVQIGFLILLLTGVSKTSYCQKNSYEIKGFVSNVKSGKIYLTTTQIDRKYYRTSSGLFDSAEITNGFFNILLKYDNKIISPFRFYVQGENVEGETGIVFLSQRNQSIKIDTISEYISPFIAGSETQTEMRNDYTPFFKHVIQKGKHLDSIGLELVRLYKNNIPFETEKEYRGLCNDLVKMGDSTFLEYVKKYPNSYVTLWKLIERFETFGYKKQYSNAFALLSTKVKETYPAKIFIKELLKLRKYSEGNLFPKLLITDTAKKKYLLDMNARVYNITLIDFWYSDCLPCLKQFPRHKLLYNQFNRRGFDIISISVDKVKDFLKWKEIIKSENMTWNHFIDFTPLNSTELSLKFFPTNFLIGKDGRILKRNIALWDLEKFLDKNLSVQVYDNIYIDPE